jgi:glycerol-3-phosphate acyltransferase PlsY
MIKQFNDINEHTKHLIDGASIATVMGTLMSWLPAVAALFSIVWTVIRIYETKTVQKLLKKGE